MGPLTVERVVEVAVSAERPAVVIDQGGDQACFVVLVKPDWTGVRRLFWTALFCCRHRYASFETPLIGACRHKVVARKRRFGLHLCSPTRVQTLFAYLSQSHVILKRSISVVGTTMS